MAGDRFEGSRPARAAAAAGRLRGLDRCVRVPAGEAALWPNSRRVGAGAVTASDASLPHTHSALMQSRIDVRKLRPESDQVT